MSFEIGLWLSVLSLTIWIILLLFRGQFWRCNQQLSTNPTPPPLPQSANLLKSGDQPTQLAPPYPSICVVIPARNEAELLPITLRSLLTQNYPGHLTVVLVDDHSTDQTATIAQNVAQELGKTQQLQVLSAETLPPGWTGKLWALHQGTQYAQSLTPAPDYFLLTDADIEHNAFNIRQLVAKAQQKSLDLVSLMVKLRCESFWEKFLIPSFVFFFQKLYPFPWVNDPRKPIAAAAGGCILITRAALTRIGGLQSVRNALIDDCALAKAVKQGSHGSSQIWLGLTNSTRSLRAYESLGTIWEMVARTAFTQLNYSLGLLIITIIGMTIVYLVPPVSTLLGLLTGSWLIAVVGLASWLSMTYAYLPTVRFYGCSPWLAVCLPAIALLYTLMTVDSALRHWQKRGGAWKGRVYSETLE